MNDAKQLLTPVRNPSVLRVTPVGWEDGPRRQRSQRSQHTLTVPEPAVGQTTGFIEALDCPGSFGAAIQPADKKSTSHMSSTNPVLPTRVTEPTTAASKPYSIPVINDLLDDSGEAFDFTLPPPTPTYHPVAPEPLPDRTIATTAKEVNLSSSSTSGSTDDSSDTESEVGDRNDRNGHDNAEEVVETATSIEEVCEIPIIMTNFSTPLIEVVDTTANELASPSNTRSSIDDLDNINTREPSISTIVIEFKEAPEIPVTNNNRDTTASLWFKSIGKTCHLIRMLTKLHHRK